METRIGIMRNADGSLSAGPCRAKPGNEGTGRCKHFKHVTSKKQAEQYISMMTTHADAMQIVDFSRDVNSMSDNLSQYLQKRGFNPDDLPTDTEVPIMTSWFHNDSAKAEKFLREAQEEGVLPKITTSKEFSAAIASSVNSGIKVEVCADRVVGLKTPADVNRDTDVWMTANKVSMKSISGEAPLMLMVDEGKSEREAANNVRDKYTGEPANEMSDARREDFATAGYACLHGGMAN